MNRCSKADIQDAVCLFYFVGEIQEERSRFTSRFAAESTAPKSVGVWRIFLFWGFFGWLVVFLKVKKQTQVVFVSSKVEALAKPPRMPLPPSACMTISFVSSVPKKTFPLVLGNC